MATLTFYQAGNMFSTSLWKGELLSFTSTQIVLSNGHKMSKWIGSFQNGLTGATVTGNQYYVDDVLASNLANANADAIPVANYVLSGNVQGLYNYVFQSDDTIIGSAMPDRIRGYDGNDMLSGGEGNDTLEGGVGDDTLTGGNGDDKLVGGVGDDTYTIIDLNTTSGKAADTIYEKANQGTDSVICSISYTLTSNIENLTLATGAANIDGSGNGIANTILGNAGINTIDGKGGNDTLTGGAGNDIFRFDTAIGTNVDSPTNADLITDFISGSDDINLSSKIFTVYKTAFNVAKAAHIEVDLSGSFASGADLKTAASADIHIIYDTSTGNLYYDPDGDKLHGKDAIQFATLDGNPTLLATDLHIV
jgi:Ca2+-binding RTX toxin-like protein